MDLFASKVAAFGPRLAKDFALADFQAAGAFGNIGHECAGFRLMQEVKPAVAGSAGGYGWCQWTGPRRRAYEAWCAARGLDKASDAANYGYLCEELRSSEAAAVAALRKAKTLSEATDAFCRTFERPGVVNLPSRMTWANKALAAMQGAPGAASASAPLKSVPTAATAPARPGFLARLKDLFLGRKAA